MTTAFNEIKTCEVCGNADLASVLDLGLHPMCDDLVPIGEDRTCQLYPIEILYCPVCRTAHQRYQVPKQDLFPQSYHYRSRFTADVLTGMSKLVDSCVDRFGALRNKLVLDVGCNDGSLLSFFRAKGARTVGIEPTGAWKDAAHEGHAVYNGFLSETLADRVRTEQGIPDYIVFTNVFAHIEDLGEVIRSLKLLIGPRTVIVIENHYLGSVLDGNQFDTFYHEHPRTYSYTSFVHIARALDVPLAGVEFPSRYGGNIRVFLGGGLQADASTPAALELDHRESQFPERFATMRRNLEAWRVKKRRELAALVAKHGRLSAKAFPGRAAILITLLGLDETSISAVHEKPGSMKIGHYLPGTRVPIESDDCWVPDAQGGAPLLNLAWHIPEEIRAYLRGRGYSGPILDIVNATDFASNA